MDAVTTAALAVVVEESRDAAMLALLQERERLAMTVADQASYMAQRHYVGSLQVPRPDRPMTWEAAFTQRHNDLVDAHHAMRGAIHAIRDSDSEGALNVLEHVVGNDTDESSDEDEEMESTAAGEEEEEEEEEAEEDAAIDTA